MLVSGLKCKTQTQRSKAYVDKELGCQSQVREETILDLDHHIYGDHSSSIAAQGYLEVTTYQNKLRIHIFQAVRSCFLISNLLINKKERIQQRKVSQSSQISLRSSYYSKFSLVQWYYYTIIQFNSTQKFQPNSN
ncbi:Hypothetical_protein [Hexamita inflata]|uniref:Hypothetical_protein n=1 Tax=Hexamita inflata TaxID=28002 RepID=A0AA86U2U3_9EUKA|nr:Hypothetical protein HINF_LOCUS25994 [Hexamita inflata]